MKMILTAAILAAATLHAADGTLSVSPAVVMLRGNPGQSTTQKLTIFNSTSRPYAFEMVAKDVVVRGGERSFVDAGTRPGSIAATAVFSQPAGTVAPGERMTVSVTVTVPENPSSRAMVALFHGTTRIQREGFALTASLGLLLTFTLSDEVHAKVSPLAITPPTEAEPRRLSRALEPRRRAGDRARPARDRRRRRRARRETVDPFAASPPG